MSTVYLDILDDGVTISDAEGEPVAMLAQSEASALLAAAETMVSCSHGSNSMTIVVRKPDGGILARLRLITESGN